MFPYEAYKTAVVDESDVRGAGVEAMLINVERDGETGRLQLGIEPLGRCAETDLEGGTVTQDGEDGFSGEIVSYDAEAKILSLKAGARGNLVEGANLTIRPPDYLKKLREFAEAIAGDAEEQGAPDERFMNLRASLLAAEPATALVHGQEHLRKSQRAAVAMALSRDFSFIWGPPGTGKSYTLGHVAQELVASGKRVLVLSTTNASVDTLVFALDDAFNRMRSPLAIGDLVRYTQTLTHKDEYARRPHLMAYTKVLERYAKDLRELEKRLKKHQKTLRTLAEGGDEATSERFKAAAVTEQIKRLTAERKAEVAALLGGAKIVCASITSCLFNGFQKGAFDAILVDEASLIPRAVWPCLLHGSASRRFVVAGDPMQLPPVGGRSHVDETVPWFEQNIFTYLGLSTYAGAVPFMKAGSVTLLREQTRMRRGICARVSRQFYNGLVVGDRTEPPRAWTADVPEDDVVLLDPARCVEPYGVGRIPERGWAHTCAASANVVLDLLERLARNASAEKPLSVLVLCPFRNQAKSIYGYHLRGRHWQKGFSVECSTVHRSQGGEADVVIFDLVEPGNWFLNNAAAAHLWCVACSRAKEKLIVVGDEKGVRHGNYSGPMFADVRVKGLGEVSAESLVVGGNKAA